MDKAGDSAYGLGDADASELEELEDCQLHAVRAGLFLGSVAAEASLGSAAAPGSVSHVLQVGGGLRPSYPDTYEYKQIDVDDDEREDIVAHFPSCFAFIDEARQNGGQGGVLVHCSAGCSRSAAVCLGYVMWKENLCYEDAWRVVHAARPWICPNDGFKKQLREFERIGYDLTQWKSWAAVEAAQLQLTRAAAEAKLVTDCTQFCDLGPL